VRSAISEQVERLISFGYETFVSGGALGFDMLAAEAVIDLRQKYPGIRLILAIPCTDHDAKWSVNEQIRFSVIKRYADGYVYVSDAYTSRCMLKRNRYMVDNSSHCISYCMRSDGGTAYTVRYASAQGVPVTEISTLI
jgi:uncharacterized phage-like protein YoqJ